MSGKETQRFNLYLLIGILLVFCGHESCTAKNAMLIERRAEELLPYVSPTTSPMPFLPPSPTASPMPFLPLLAPSPLTPFTNSTVPKLSGLCPLNFTALQNMMMVTSTDCLGSFAPLLANVVCCPQLEATLIILIGQSSKQTNTLSLNQTLARHCLSDFEQILVGQGANDSLPKICSIHSSNLTEGSCPIADVAEFESTVDSSNLLAACEKIDSVNECCKQVCENAILDASRKLAEKAYNLTSLDSSHVLSDHSTRVNDCKSVVVRWLGSKLEPSRAKDVFRGLSNCRINKVCPLTFPNTSHIIQGCGVTSNQSTCCSAVESYVTHLQRQSFVTNLQALNCATSLGVKLRKANITQNVYSQCHISLKDFSLQVGAQESGGCLLPTLPSDVVFDISAGVSFRCDLNDNIPAPWPATSEFPASSCNKSVKMPALPAAASGQSSRQSTYTNSLALFMFLAMLLILMLQ